MEREGFELIQIEHGPKTDITHTFIDGHRRITVEIEGVPEAFTLTVDGYEIHVKRPDTDYNALFLMRKVREQL